MTAIARELRGDRAKLVADAQALINKADPTAEDLAKFDMLMDEADGLKAKIDRIERAVDAESDLRTHIDKRSRNAGIPPDEIREGDQLYENAFDKLMRFGAATLTMDESQIVAGRIQKIQNAQGVGAGSGGGYTVPQGFYQKIIDAQLAFGGMLNVSHVIETDSGNQLPIPTDNDTGAKGSIIGENAVVSDQDIVFGQAILNAYMYSSGNVRVSMQLLQDSAFKLDDFVSEKLGVRNARIMNDHFTFGAGSGQPAGVIAGAYLGKTGVAGQTTSIIYDDLVDLTHGVDPAYRDQSRFMFHDTTLRALRKLKDTMGRPLWQAGLDSRAPDTINGYPYSINQSMPVMAANAKSVLFGDFSNYMIRRVTGGVMMRLTERYADQGQVAFLLWQRADGRLIDAGTHPIAYYANSAT